MVQSSACISWTALIQICNADAVCISDLNQHWKIFTLQRLVNLISESALKMQMLDLIQHWKRFTMQIWNTSAFPLKRPLIQWPYVSWFRCFSDLHFDIWQICNAELMQMWFRFSALLGIYLMTKGNNCINYKLNIITVRCSHNNLPITMQGYPRIYFLLFARGDCTDICISVVVKMHTCSRLW